VKEKRREVARYYLKKGRRVFFRENQVVHWGEGNFGRLLIEGNEDVSEVFEDYITEAELYGVETRDINKAVKNNPDKFPDGYIFKLNKAKFEDLQWKISTATFSKTRVLPNAFTKKGLYILATILKSPQATQTIEWYIQHRKK